jgi:hypothetical protein
MRHLPLLILLLLAACNREGVVDDAFAGTPPDDVIQMRTADWSSLLPAEGQRPAESGMLTKGPIVTDLNALTGKDAIAFRHALNARGGPLTRDRGLLFTVSPPGPDAIYLIVDPQQRAIEAGWKAGGRWVVRRTAASEIVRPMAVEALYRE